jgi:hypothetical protein
MEPAQSLRGEGDQAAVSDDEPQFPESDNQRSPHADARVYFNHCTVNLSLTTAELDLGQASAADQSVRVTSRLITSPSYFRQMGALIRAECDRYDADLSEGKN